MHELWNSYLKDSWGACAVLTYICGARADSMKTICHNSLHISDPALHRYALCAPLHPRPPDSFTGI
eukprot:314785-Ditylum_brightwellii.AAC.1